MQNISRNTDDELNTKRIEALYNLKSNWHSKKLENLFSNT